MSKNWVEQSAGEKKIGQFGNVPITLKPKSLTSVLNVVLVSMTGIL
jgi:hypothetical protein